MLGLLLAAMGVLGASLVLSDQNDDDNVSNDGPPDEEDVGEVLPPITLPEEPVVDGPRQFGTVSISPGPEDQVATPFDDVIVIENETVRGESGRSIPVSNSVDAGAGNDRLYTSGGIGIGGEGNDTISLFVGGVFSSSQAPRRRCRGLNPLRLGVLAMM